MRYLFIFLLACCPLAIAQTTNAHPITNPFAGYLEADFQIRHASARPAARLYYLIRAAAYDRYASENQPLLSAHPTLKILVQDAKSRDLASFTEYPKTIGQGGFPPVVDRNQELTELEKFIASGYSGGLKPKLLAYLEELKK